ncbi:MAG: NAD(P)H-dependent glycerol-3-phosphate dehydrogenase [Chloroflexota bacterium]
MDRGVPARAVIGAGGWGTALALLLARRGPVTLLARTEADAAAIAALRVNERHLPGIVLPPEVVVTADPGALNGAVELVVMAVPSRYVRETARRVAPFVPAGTALLSVTKGLETGTLLRMSEVLGEEIVAVRGRIAALSGPNLAPEIARGLPASSVVGCPDEAVGAAIVSLLGSRTFRLYTNRDIVGVELAGALKNIIAIAAGAVDRLGYGDSGKAAIVTRGLAEMTRLGVAAGANPLTFAGLAGVGDVLATCASPLSRNHRLGMELASGRRWSEIEAALPGVAEGAYTVDAAIALAARLGVELPIAQEVHRALFEDKPVERCLADLLARESKAELAGLEGWGSAAGS